MAKKVNDSKKDKCSYCKQDIKESEFYIIYRLFVVTNVQVHFIGLQKILNELGDFCMEKCYHLSASQIVLLRPDILKDFLEEKLGPEKVIYTFLQEFQICKKCFEEYKTIIPEK